MISGIGRLRAKKGFTMIEMIVVIAIIGILTSIVVAAFSYDTRPSAGKAMAKDFYYVVQDSLSDSEIAAPTALKSFATSSTRPAFYITLDNHGGIVSSGMLTVGNYNGAKTPAIGNSPFPATINVKHDRTEADDLNLLELKMRDSMTHYVTEKSGMEGTLVALCDVNYRVVCAYWTEFPITTMPEPNALTADNVMANGTYCCAYPTDYSTEGRHVFGVYI